MSWLLSEGSLKHLSQKEKVGCSLVTQNQNYNKEIIVDIADSYVLINTEMTTLTVHYFVTGFYQSKRNENREKLI